MKNINIEKLPSGSYRIRKQINGKNIQIVFDHKPSQAEIIKSLSSKSDIAPVKGTFYACAKSYIASRNNSISPSTICGYESILRSIPKSFKNKKISSIVQVDIQTLVNDYASDHTPKSVRNLHGFVSAVLRQFRPDMLIHTTLPQKEEKEGYIPSEKDIKRILDASKGSVYHIPIQLAIMGLRRSEICALTLDDIDVENNLLTINKAKVRDDRKPNKWNDEKGPKTEYSNRSIYIPDSLVNEIMENGKVYDGYPGQILKNLHRYQDRLGLPRFRLHDMRHFFASYAHSQGVSDADIMATGGWKSDYTMKSIYRHEMNQKQAQKTIFNKLIS